MDREIRAGLRAARAAGLSVPVIKELIMHLDEEDRLEVFRFARFWKERYEPRIFLGNQVVQSRFLSADFIERFLEQPKGYRNTDLPPQWKWEQPVARYQKHLIKDEAEYRGIKKKQATAERIASRIADSCIDRQHKWEHSVAGWQCLSCHRKVTDEEIVTYRNR